jgi:thiol-disulfide isomerase/thioredoxin
MKKKSVAKFKFFAVFLLNVALCLLYGPLSAGEKTGAKVQLKVVKHADLVKAIEAHKGKVVLVDFWATWCAPCVAKFPKIVQMQEEFRDKGLVCISVSLDKPTKQDKALDFLTDKKATFPNYLVENPDACQDHWDFVAIPTYLLFGKDGKLVQKFTTDPDAKTQVTIEDLHKAVEKQLK